MRTSDRHRPLLFTLLLASACTAELPLPEGLACDEAHPCLEGRVCGMDGLCHPPGSQPSVTPSPAPSPTPEPPLPTSPMTPTPPSPTLPEEPLNLGVRWRQREAGFTAVEACSEGCGASLDAAQGHQLSVRIPAGVADTAGAEVTRQEQLPAAPVGRLRGRIIVPPGTALEGQADLLMLQSRSTGGALLRLSVGPGGVLGAESAAGTLGREHVTVADTGGRLVTGRSHLVEASFRQGAFLRVWLDGELLVDRELAAFDDVDAGPDALWLGARPQGAPAAPLELAFRDWQLSELAEPGLTD
ncbi:MAG: hypothetical protein L0Y66_14090 [Myxococcaceae bacterium]|nr:hypothetical protein [Myxococcaceae bacterium]MCI0669717.1 hypothetical protein [Myxococcaceae bacterium]